MLNTETLGVQGRGLMAQAADGVRIQAPTKFVMEDATGTSKKSPLAVADTEIDIIVPADAIWLVLNPVGADVRVAIVDAGTAAAPYLVIKDGTKDSLPVSAYAGSGVASIFLLRDAAVSLTLHFRFELIGK